ncbi:hypothetical protein [Sporosarcina ureilytica]|uniref:hypothetical protein n=1 Tax=Sporosarcina ureilytica TaxID=298596 RepID=UPI0012DB51F4|nr:hypothetical protein [Sporosarcina ureilytica]
MSSILFLIFHVLIGIAFIYLYGKLPKALATFCIVFFTFSILYWTVIILDIFSSNWA